MRKFNLIFISLIGLATLALGLLWGQVQLLAATQASIGNIVLIVLSGLFLILALLALGRILLRLAPVASAGGPGEHQEVEK